MLDIALTFLKNELSTYLTARTGPSPAEVKLTKIVDESGKYFEPLDTIGMNLISFEEERIIKEHLPKYTIVDGQHIVQEPELRLNLYVLFAMNFQQYDQALKYLSWVVTFFQSHPSFTAVRYPTLDARIDKLLAELQPVNFEQMNQIWAFIGGKQLPCVVYKVRMVILQDTEPDAIQPPITIIETNVESQV
jgi:hypothetical protein